MKRAIEQFRRRVLANTEWGSILDPERRALVGVSGGPDSVALLDALSALAAEMACILHVLHIDHGLRGAESDADREFVADLARSMNLPFHSKQIRGLDRQSVSEDQLRQIRYDFLVQKAKRLKCRAIFLGHHADDLAETLLLRLSRGAGIEGLAGFGPVERRGDTYLFRPMIDIFRAEIIDYLKARNLDYRVDSSNADRRFTRNRVRHEILPLMAELNPRINESLARTARLLTVDAECLSSLAEDEFKNHVEWGSSIPALKLENWRGLHEAIRTRILRQVLRRMTTQETSPYSRPIAAIDKIAMHGRSGNFVVAPGNIVAYRKRQWLYFVKIDTPGRPTRQQIEEMIN